MAMSTITPDRYEEVLRRHLKYLPDGAELGPDADLKSLGLDSMAAVNLLFDLEDTFDIVLPDEALVERTFATPAALQQTIDKSVGGGGL